LQALLVFLRLQADDWLFRPLLAALTNNYFNPTCPEWRVSEGTVESGCPVSAAAEWAIRQLQIPQGREDLLAELQRNANREKPEPQTTAGSDLNNEAD